MELKLLQITDRKIKQFYEAGIFSVEDLLGTCPKKYVDARKARLICDVHDGETCRIDAYIKYLNVTSKGIFLTLTDNVSNKWLKVAFFHADYLAEQLYEGAKMSIVGKFKYETYNGRTTLSISNPKRFCIDEDKLNRIIPIYKKIPGMSDDYYEACINKALQEIKKDDFLGGDILMEQDLCTFQAAFQMLHIPSSVEDIKKAKKRLDFNSLFLFNLLLEEKHLADKNESPYVFTGCKLMQKYYESMPFDLTDGQKEVVRELYLQGRKGKRISTLLQADVGYGKTECAKMLSLFGVEAGCQVVIVAPTMVLAKQHYEDFSKSFEGLPVKIAYLSSEVRQKAAKKIKEQVQNGEIDILIGTHACLSDSVVYKKLGVVVVDEEHKFGVKQREKLIERTRNGVHSLSMSATPIPRTLALSIYGDDIKVSTIKTAPAFKKPIITSKATKDEAIREPLLEQLRQGHQAYIICPAIGDEEDKEPDMAKNGDVGKKYQDFLEPYGYKVGVLDGKMKKDKMAKTITDFANNKTQVLVSTTVVEVGVNVPNATLIIVKNAERFGLAQLHQLRGRVGRGKEQGYCILESKVAESSVRLQALVDSNDGFYLAEKDLETRGAGQLTGTLQKGKNPFIDMIIKNPTFNDQIKKLVKRLYKEPVIKEYFEDYFANTISEMLDEAD